MTVEVACGRCRQRFLAPKAGVVVQCPHCRAKVSVPAAWVTGGTDQPRPDAPAAAPSAAAVPAVESMASLAVANPPTPSVSTAMDKAPESPAASIAAPEGHERPLKIPAEEQSHTPADLAADATHLVEAEVAAAEAAAAGVQAIAAAIVETGPASPPMTAAVATVEPVTVVESAVNTAPASPLLNVSPAPSSAVAVSGSNYFAAMSAAMAQRSGGSEATREFPVSTTAVSPPASSSSAIMPEGAASAGWPGGIVGSGVATARGGDVDLSGFSLSNASLGTIDDRAMTPSAGALRVAATGAVTLGDFADFGAAAGVDRGGSLSGGQQVTTESSMSGNTGYGAAIRSLEEAPPSVPLKYVLILASYASAMSLLAFYLLYVVFSGQITSLESLPDIKPPMQGNKIGLRLVPPQSQLPRGHVLNLGESGRFGNIVVTPIRVSRGRVRFESADGGPVDGMANSEPLFRLKLKFENISSGQKFCPLDRELLFLRIQGPSGQAARSNQFLCELSERSWDGNLLLPFDLPVSGDPTIAGLGVDRDLAPGETCDVMIPTEELGLSTPSGELVWRVHFRKGYNNWSGRGVTALVDVRFHSDQIEDEAT